MHVFTKIDDTFRALSYNQGPLKLIGDPFPKFLGCYPRFSMLDIVLSTTRSSKKMG